MGWGWGRGMAGTLRQADWGGSMVPPPTVPISMEGMVQVMYRSSPLVPAFSIRVMQFELATFCAGSCVRGGGGKKQ